MRPGSPPEQPRLTPRGAASSPGESGPFPPALPFPGASALEGDPSSPRHRTRALILVGHGSHLNADSSAPVYSHAAAIRATGVFDEVHEAFWKEEPPLTSVLELADADDVLILPLFLSEGYFTREVLPREIGLTGLLTRREGRAFRYLPPVGTHPAMVGMILRRAEAVLGRDALRRRQATLVVIGHGTERNATSADTVYQLVEKLRASGDFGAVTCGFLDEAPRIADVLDTIRSPEIVLVPFFVAEGWHTRETIPAELGLDGDVTRRADTTIWYTPPVGTLPEMVDVILEMTEDAEASEDPSASTTAPDEGSTVDGASPGSRRTTAREAFFAHLAGATAPVRLMDVVIERLTDGRFRLRHREDLSREVASLAVHQDPEDALEIGRFRADGSYRAMRSSADLRAGWVFPALDEDGLWRALARLYPTALQEWFRGTTTGQLPAAGFQSWSSRQTAMYANVRKLGAEGVQQVVDTLCATCHRTRRWINDAGQGEAEATPPAARPAHIGISLAGDRGFPTLAVPCLEPCTLFATHARDRVISEVDDRLGPDRAAASPLP